MKITLNDEIIKLDGSNTIKTLIDKLNYKLSNESALAVNETVIPKVQWNEYWLKDGDDILLFQIITGG